MVTQSRGVLTRDYTQCSVKPSLDWSDGARSTGEPTRESCERERRLVQRARGYAATFVAGVQTVADDDFTGELPGRIVRGPQADRSLR